MDYDALLDRAHESMPDGPQKGGDRLRVPDPEGETDGAFTRLTNLDRIADALSRDPKHLHRYVQREFGTNGQYEDGRGRYNGSFTLADFTAAVDGYVEAYVTCSECGLPDTRIVPEDGVEMLRCTACGAFRPVGKIKKQTSTTRPTVETGGTYEVEITGTGRKGDGVAHKGKYTVFVPGASEGQTVRVRIDNTSGDLAFASLVN
jgi:translation initiation factor 2 subunit 2